MTTQVVKNAPNSLIQSANTTVTTTGIVFASTTASTTVAGRVAANGNFPILVTQVGTFVSGSGDTRNITLTLGTSSVNLPSVASNAAAQDTGFQTLTTALLISDTRATTNRPSFSISVSPTGAGNEFLFGALTTATATTSAGSPGTSPILVSGGTNVTGKLPIKFGYVQAPAQVPTLTLTSPTTLGSTSGRIVATWTAPDNGGTALTGYRLVWSTDSLQRSNNNEVTVSGSTLTYNVDGLIPGTRYYFKVFAKNAVTDAAGTTGPYPDAQIKNIVAEGTPVNAPTLTAANPSATVLGRVDLTWTAAPATLSPITRYKVYADNVQIADVASNVLSHIATGLNQRQTYSFTVRALNAYAVTNSTTGPNSNALERQSPGVPSAPRNLSGVSVENSVNLSWDVPENVGTTGGSITQYEVLKSGFTTAITATGGTITQVTRNGIVWKVHTFLSSANFTVSNAGSDGEIRYLVVGGGGSGGKSATGAAGGGGGGGFNAGVAFLSNGTYAVTVGAGGAAKTTTAGIGNSGVASSIAGVASAAGGGGGGTDSLAGASGASGGGGGAGTVAFAGGTGTSGLGQNGGTGFGSNTPSQISAGGGGGAGAVGASGVINLGGNGGTGLSSNIITETTASFYAGGGGGGHNNTSASRVGGTGGGGAGGRSNGAGSSGTANTGGGGGGGGANQNSGAGGSGIVVITYPTATPVLSRQAGALPRTFTHTGRVIGSTYSYVVRARNAIGDTNNTTSANSNIASVLISVSGPENFTVEAATDAAGRLVLSWSEPATSTGYKIFQVIDGSDVLIQDLGLVTVFKIDELTAGTTYTYKIKATSIAQPQGGYFSGPVDASPNAGSVQTVPSVAVTNDTNERFSGTFATINVTATTLEYANENPSYPENTVPATFGTIDNLTNQNLEGTYTIAIPTSDTITFSRVGSDIPANTSVAQGTLTNETNVPLVGTKTALAGTTGSSILYSVTSPDVTAEDATGTVTGLTSREFNETGAEITAVTETTFSYALAGEDDLAPSVAAGTVSNKTNAEIFNGEDIEVDTIVGYDTVSYNLTGASALLNSAHSSTVDYPLDAVEKVDSEAELTVKYRSGWLA